MQSGVSLQSFNTQPPEGGWGSLVFHHSLDSVVSTHSRPKAAGTGLVLLKSTQIGFNTQPPEGGWGLQLKQLMLLLMFQHTAARRRLDVPNMYSFGK